MNSLGGKRNRFSVCLGEGSRRKIQQPEELREEVCTVEETALL